MHYRALHVTWTQTYSFHCDGIKFVFNLIKDRANKLKMKTKNTFFYHVKTFIYYINSFYFRERWNCLEAYYQKSYNNKMYCQRSTFLRFI